MGKKYSGLQVTKGQAMQAVLVHKGKEHPITYNGRPEFISGVASDIVEGVSVDSGAEVTIEIRPYTPPEEEPQAKWRGRRKAKPSTEQ